MPDVVAAASDFIRYFHQSNQFYHILTDTSGTCKYINPLFLQLNGIDLLDADEMPFAAFIPPGEAKTYQHILKLCIAEPGKNFTADFHQVLPDATNKLVKWEFQALPAAEIGQPMLVQAIGIAVHEKNNSTETGISQSERYMAYASGAEGLWRLELEVPVSASLPVAKLIDHCKKYGYLAECNDNMATMYGLSSADDMAGMRLESLMKLDDPVHARVLENFVENGFVINDAETSEFDINGNKLYIVNNMTGIVENGMLKRIWGTQQNITEKKKAEEQLMRSELFYKNLIAESLDGILLTDTNGLITYASQPIEKILGFLPEDVVGTTAFDYVHEEDKAAAFSAFQDEVQMEPRTKFIQIRIRSKFGGWVYCNVRGHNLLYNPYVGRMMIYFQDYTQRRKTETALRETEDRIRNQALLLNNVSDSIVTVDLSMVITSWNARTEESTGISAGEALGKNYREVIPLDFSPQTAEDVTAAVTRKGVWRGEASFTNHQGEKLTHLYTISLILDELRMVKGLLIIAKDITDRIKMEAQLKQSESFYKNLIANSLDGILLSDRQGKIIYCGPSVSTLSGYENDQVLGKDFFAFVHPDDIAKATEAFSREITSKPEHSSLSLRLRRADNSWVWCIVRAHNLLDDPAVNALVIYFTDDSRRKATEEKLRESERNFRLLLNNLSTGVILFDAERKMLMSNKAGYEIFGLTEEELFSRDVFAQSSKVTHEDGSVFTVDEYPVIQAINTRKLVKDVVIGVLNEKTGKRVWLLMSAEPVLDAKNEIRHVICSFIDVTEQKRLAQALIDQEVHKQKLLTQATIDGQEKERKEIGKELHDNINQHLTTTRLYLELAGEKASGEVKEMVQHAHKELKDIFEEIRRLSQSLVPPTLGDIGLIESIQDVLGMLQRTHTFSTELIDCGFREDQLPDNMKLMFFRIIQEQVSNIIRHAAAKRIEVRLVSNEQKAELIVYDDGNGFDSAKLKKGLGLTNIANRAALFDGTVNIESAPGKGCRLTVTIPLNNKTVSQQ